MIIALFNLTMLLENVLFFYTFFCRGIRPGAKKEVIELSTCFIIFAVAVLNHVDFQKITLGPLSLGVIWSLCICYFIFDYDILPFLIVGVCQWLILSIIEVTTIISLQRIIAGEQAQTMLSMLMVIVVCIFILGITGRKSSQFISNLPAKIGLLIDVLLFVLNAMLSFFSYVVNQYPDKRVTNVGQLLSSFSGIVLIVLLFLIMFFCNSFYEVQTEKQIVELNNLQQKEYFQQLLKREEETRRFRHDIINELLEMQNFCQQKKCTQAQSYLKEMLGDIENISRDKFDLGNDIVNTVINYYLMPIRKKYNVVVSGYISEHVTIDDRDLCVLVSNVVKNAVDAVTKLDDGNIFFKMEEGNEYLLIEGSNSADHEYLVDKRGNLITTKSNKKDHGFGMKNISQIISKYKGAWDVKFDDKTFYIRIYLKK